MKPTTHGALAQLQDALSPEELAHGFVVVQARLARRRRVRRVGAAVTLGLAVAVLGFGWRAERGSRVETVEPGPLVAAAGAPMPEAIAAADAEQTVTMADHSSVRLMPRARVRVHENNGRRLWLKQERGAVEYEVTPGGPRMWRVDVGHATVEVLGTHFWVREIDGRVAVEVTRGKVLVKSAELPSGDVLLAAGERVDVAPPASATPPEAAPIAEPLPPPTPAPAPLLNKRASAPRQASPPTPPVTELPTASSFEALLVRSEEAREAGQFAQAAGPLREALSRFPYDARSDIARMALANLLLDRLKAPDEAFEVLNPWLRAQTRSSLSEEGLARLVEAAVRTGRAEEARLRYAQFVTNFPNSSRLAAVNRWLSKLDAELPP